MTEENRSETGGVLEETTDVAIGDAGVGKFNLVIWALIVLACLFYLATELDRPVETREMPKEAVPFDK